MNMMRWLNKKGISTDILVVILLIVGLAIGVLILISLTGSGRSNAAGLLNLTTPLKSASGL
jgi:hypothetical protein